MIAWLLASHALALEWPFDPAPLQQGSEAPYAGVFDALPTFHFRVRLPGPPLNAASHSEWSKPTLVGKDVLVGSAAGNALYALSRRNGAVRRVFEAESSVESPPTVHGGRLYFSDTAGNTYCFDLDSGEQLWVHDSVAPFLVAPTVAEAAGLLIATSVDDLAVALHLDTGELAWQFRAPPDPTRRNELALYAAPRAVVDGDQVIVGFSTGQIAGIELESGRSLWTQDVGEGRYPDVVASPVLHANDVFTSGYFRPLVAIDRPTNNVRWRIEVGAANAVALDAENERLFHPGSDGVLRAVATLTGAEIWRWDSQKTGALTTPLQTPVGLVVGSSDGGLYIVDAESGAERWRWREPYLLLGVSAQPTVEGRQLLFVSNSGYLYSMLAP